MTKRVLQYLPIVCILVAAVVLTRYNYFGDTPGYVENIAAFDRGAFEPKTNPLWDFGHLLLRPLGWVVFRVMAALAPHAFGPDPRIAICWALIGASVVSGVITVLLLRSLARQFLTNAWAADLVAAGFLCFYAFLNYFQSGTSYIIGLMWMTLSLRLAIAAAQSQRLRDAILAGVTAALAALFWLPYVCALGGIFAVFLFWSPSVGRSRERAAGACAVAAIVVVGIAYAVALANLRLHSIAEIREWALASSHGWSQSKRFLRIWTGLPRSFLWLGNEGLLLKRYVLHDPYSPVTLGQIVREQLWRMTAFYAFLLCVLWSLVRSPGGKRIFAILAAAALPLLFFAVVVFEPGSAERYLPVFPFLCLAVAFSIARAPSRIAAFTIAAFLMVAIAANVTSLWRPALIAKTRVTEQRARALRDRVGSRGVVAVATFSDDLYWFAGSLAFDPLSPVQIHLPVYDVIQIGNERLRTWKQDFAMKALNALNAGDCVWVSKRLLAERPARDWGWAEGDDARIAWRELRPFFVQFQYSGEAGGTDGFVQLTDSSKNREILSNISRPPSQASGRCNVLELAYVALQNDTLIR